MARSTILSVSPDLDLDKGFAQIEAERLAQTQGAQRFGTDMDTRLQQLYGQLTGSLQQGVQTTQGIYSGAGAQTQQAYQQGGAVAGNASTMVQSRLSEMAQRLGLSQEALSEVSGRLGEQAMGHQFRNMTSMADRLGTLSQLGAGMSAVSQFAVNAAQQAMAQGRHDLARRVTLEIQRANTLAAAARTDFTAVKANQAARAAAAAEKEAASAMKELIREQRAAARAARSGGGGGRRGSPYADEDQAMQRARFEAFMEDRNAPYEPSPFERAWGDYQQSTYGPKARNYIEQRLSGGKPSAKGLNKDAMERTVAKLKNSRMFN